MLASLLRAFFPYGPLLLTHLVVKKLRSPHRNAHVILPSPVEYSTIIMIV